MFVRLTRDIPGDIETTACNVGGDENAAKCYIFALHKQRQALPALSSFKFVERCNAFTLRHLAVDWNGTETEGSWARCYKQKCGMDVA